MTATHAAGALAAVIALAVGPAAFADEGAHKHHAGAATTTPAQKPWGMPGDAKAAGRTIAIAMSDAMRFTPSTIEVRQGETVRFVVSNKGKLLHEMVIGDKASLDAHAALMAGSPAMEHDAPGMAHVRPGRKDTLVWTFNRPGEFAFACLIAGHYQAGMVGTIRVAPQ